MHLKQKTTCLSFKYPTTHRKCASGGLYLRSLPQKRLICTKCEKGETVENANSKYGYVHKLYITGKRFLKATVPGQEKYI